MALNKRGKKEDIVKQADNLADELADRTHGKSKDYQARTTIALPKSLLSQLELKAFQNKQKGIEPKSVSALVRESLTAFGYMES